MLGDSRAHHQCVRVPLRRVLRRLSLPAAVSTFATALAAASLASFALATTEPTALTSTSIASSSFAAALAAALTATSLAAALAPQTARAAAIAASAADTTAHVQLPLLEVLLHC